ncbi:putative PurR-regulated permease PerM [Methanomicrobium sp. W14]|uniref:AI-2E family transporter n=1 Tax=Methanomicrobium sp. W14 TaxID=2817839 RepID=UPI001AE6BF28|nr:AI-2E family transporter [Methanomicrobium sp. W14]MBP2133825.1 putative PurR-regulated permease PerM [Methanomicrobium sp. W14]
MDESDRITLGVVALIFILSFFAFREFLGVIIVSCSFAVVLMPLQRYISRFMKPGYSSVIITILVGFLVILAFYVTIIVIYQNAEYTAGMINSITEWVNSKLFAEMSGFMGTPSDLFSDFFSDIFSSLKDDAFDIVTMVPLVVVKVMIFFLSIFLFLMYGSDIYREIWGIIPQKSVKDMLILKNSVTDMLYAIFNVHVTVAVFVFVLSFPVFYVLGYGHILFYAVISGILALIPIFGPVFLIIFLALFAVSISDWRGLFIIFLVAWPFLCAIPDWWMRPVLMGKRASANAVLMFIAFFGGIAVMGILGFIMGPIFIALMIAGYRIIIEKYGEKENFSR